LIESVNLLLGKVAATRRSDHLTDAEIVFENGHFFEVGSSGCRAGIG
jgi:hypothetical protein